jgi:hypothetical protein
MTFLLVEMHNEFINNLNSYVHSLSFYITKLKNFKDLAIYDTFFSMINSLPLTMTELSDLEIDPKNDILESAKIVESNNVYQIFLNFITLVENTVLKYPELKILLQFFRFIFIFILNILGYFYILMKFYRVICYSKMTFEWLPMINPYEWPVSFFLTLSTPYFLYWSKLLPNLKTSKSTMEISSIIALEALNIAGILTVKFTNILALSLLEFERILAL